MSRRKRRRKRRYGKRSYVEYPDERYWEPAPMSAREAAIQGYQDARFLAGASARGTMKMASLSARGTVKAARGIGAGISFARGFKKGRKRSGSIYKESLGSKIARTFTGKKRFEEY